MTQLSANLGLLWQELELAEAVEAAHRSGFDAVETHWPYITLAVDVALLLEQLDMPMICLNTVAGDLANGDFGLAALPGREIEARAAIDKGLAYALDVSARHLHVLAGKTNDRDAADVYVENIRYAAARGQDYGVGILVEPISETSQPGYFLQRVDEAAALIARVGAPNVGLLFDCFHVHQTHGEILPLLADHLDLIGHIQIASIPDRAEPDRGLVDYGELVAAIEDLGYDGFIGAEYRPTSTTDAGLGWMGQFGRNQTRR